MHFDGKSGRTKSVGITFGRSLRILNGHKWAFPFESGSLDILRFAAMKIVNHRGKLGLIKIKKIFSLRKIFLKKHMVQSILSFCVKLRGFMCQEIDKENVSMK